jgi:hypothetical protein
MFQLVFFSYLCPIFVLINTISSPFKSLSHLIFTVHFFASLLSAHILSKFSGIFTSFNL